MDYFKLVCDLLNCLSIIRGNDEFVNTMKNIIMTDEFSFDYEWFIKTIDLYYSNTESYRNGNQEPNRIERLTRLTVCKYVTLFWQLKADEQN